MYKYRNNSCLSSARQRDLCSVKLRPSTSLARLQIYNPEVLLLSSFLTLFLFLHRKTRDIFICHLKSERMSFLCALPQAGRLGVVPEWFSKLSAFQRGSVLVWSSVWWLPPHHQVMATHHKSTHSHMCVFVLHFFHEQICFMASALFCSPCLCKHYLMLSWSVCTYPCKHATVYFALSHFRGEYKQKIVKCLYN